MLRPDSSVDASPIGRPIPATSQAAKVSISRFGAGRWACVWFDDALTIVFIAIVALIRKKSSDFPIEFSTKPPNVVHIVFMGIELRDGR